MIRRRRDHVRLLVAGCIAALGLITVAGHAEETTPEAPTEITWYYSVDQAVAYAATIGRQVGVYFYTDWCRWCRWMDDSTLSDPRVAALAERLVFARVNAESDTATAHRYRVHAYPTLLILTPEAKEVDRVVGYLSPGEFEKTMTDYLDGKGTYWDIERQMKQDPKNPELLVAIAQKYELRGEPDKARDNYKQVVSQDEKNNQGWTDDARFALARLLREEGEWYKAAEHFRRLLEDFPTTDLRADAEAYIPWLFEQAGDTIQALKYYRAFLEQNRGSADRSWAEQRIEALTPPAEE